MVSGLCAGAPRDGLADSDGYYCAAGGYLAYEFSFSKYSTGKHLLTIVFFDDAPGRIEPLDVALDPFQVHGMKCDEDSVEVLGFTALYRIDLSDRPNLAAARIRDLGGNMNAGSSINVADYRKFDNLVAPIATAGGAPSGADVTIVPLAPTNRNFSYFLHLNAYSESHTGEGGSIHNIYTHSKIVKKAGARIEDIFDIHSGYSELTVD